LYHSNSPHFGELRQYLDSIPVIETHEHFTKYKENKDAVGFVLDNYYWTDFVSAGGEEAPPDGLDARQKFEWFIRTYKRSDKTTNIRCVLEGLRQCWGVENLDSFEDFQALEKKLAERDASVYDRMMEKMGIRAKIVDVFDLAPFVEGSETGYSKYCRFALPIPIYHNLHSKQDLLILQNYLDRTITCLDDYLESLDNFFVKSIEFGVVCLKDQSAYRRSIAYGNPTRAEAESAFNEIIFKPRDIFGDDRVRVLDDWIFHYALRKAAKYGLPVQLHTGYMAGIRNDIVKTNAGHLIPTIELHRDVQFALFHGNWPYMDEYLYIGKNYPNAYLDLCWVTSTDPVYSVELMKRAVMTVPHSKVFAFGGDTAMIEWVAGYLTLTKDVVASALAELADSGWLDVEEAKRVAIDWFFNNPNEFYKLGL